MATPQGSGLGQPLQVQGQQHGQQQQQQAGAKTDMAPVLQQLSMAPLRTRTQDLYAAIGRILHAFLSNPSTKWSEVLGQFAMVNVELLNLVEDIKPILKMFVVYPKNVNAENAQILPIMLSTKLLPEMETEEAALKEQMLAKISNLPISVQTEKLQRQIEMVRSACDVAEKVMTEARKVYGLGTRQGPVQNPLPDKMHVTRIAEQEKLLRAATNYGEGLRIPADQQQQPAILPHHLSAAFSGTAEGRASSYYGADGAYMKASTPVLPPSGLRPGAQQQTSLPARVQTPTQPVGLAGSSPSQMPYIVNSPKSGGSNYNVPSPQQSQQSQQAAFMQQRSKVQQQHQLQRQQHLQQLQQTLPSQQLRRPATPPIPQAQVSGQVQAQVAQPLLQQQKQQQHLQQLQQQQQQQQSQNRLSQQYQQAQLLQQQQALQERQAMHHMQASQQQQNLQQQLQSSQHQQPGQNPVQQANQVRPQMGQHSSSMPSLYGTGTQNLLASNMMGPISQPMQSNLLQQRMQQMQQGNLNPNQLSGNQPQQNVSSMLSDSLYNMGVAGTGAPLTQNSPNLGLPLQQQQLPATNYMNMLSNFVSNNRQQPPPS